MPKLYVMIGISGCGKSTYSEKLNVPVVSSDAIRKELFGDEDIQESPEKVFALAHKRVREYLESGSDVVFDATNVSAFARETLLDAVKGVPCERIGVVFTITPEEALRRQEHRDRKVPVDVINRQHRTLQRDMDTLQSQFDRLQYV